MHFLNAAFKCALLYINNYKVTHRYCKLNFILIFMYRILMMHVWIQIEICQSQRLYIFDQQNIASEVCVNADDRLFNRVKVKIFDSFQNISMLLLQIWISIKYLVSLSKMSCNMITRIVFMISNFEDSSILKFQLMDGNKDYIFANCYIFYTLQEYIARKMWSWKNIDSVFYLKVVS